MRLIKDYTGRVFGNFTVLGLHRRNKHGQVLWRVQCVCGRIKTYLAFEFVSGRISSCGCMRKGSRYGLGLPIQTSWGRPTSHPLYSSWNHMLRRCVDPKDAAYPLYGARGITVCRRWYYYANFYDDNIGKWGEGLEIDRIDNDKGYWPGNVRFVTRKVNANNTRAVFRRKEREAAKAKALLDMLRRTKASGYRGR